MAIRRRLEILEARTPPPAPVRPGSATLDEIRALEEHIRRLEAGTDEVGTAPEAGHFLEEPELGHEIAAVLRQIELLEEMEDRRVG